MDNRYKVTRNDKPSPEQLDSWFENGDEVEFIVEQKGSFPHKDVHKGKIKMLRPLGADALILVENASWFYLRDVISYTTYNQIEPIFLETNSDSLDKIFLKAEDETFCINRTLICERIDFFRAMFSPIF